MQHHPDRTSPEDYLAALLAAEDVLTARRSEAGRAPDLTAALLAAEKWNACYLPIPPEAAAELLTAAHQAAVCCAKEAADFLDLDLEEDGEGSPHKREFFEMYWNEAEARTALIEGRFHYHGLDPPERDTSRCDCDDCNPDDEDRKMKPEDDLTLEPITAPTDLNVRTDELVKLAGMENHPATETAARNIGVLSQAADSATSPQEAETLGRMKNAAEQDFAAHVGTIAAASLDSTGQHEDAAALRVEAGARTEIAAGLRGGPSPSGPAPGAPETPPQGPAQPDFRADAEAAARANGFGPTAQTIFVQDTNAEPKGTNPEIVFEENRAAIAPGGNDYADLRAAATVQSPVAEAPADLDLEEARRPEATMTRGLSIGMGPGGAVLMEINHSPYAEPAPDPAEPAPIRPGQEAAEETKTFSIEDFLQRIERGDADSNEAPARNAGQEAAGPSIPAERFVDAAREVASARPAEEAETKTLSVAEFLENITREVAGNEGGGNEASEGAAPAFRSFGR